MFTSLPQEKLPAGAIIDVVKTSTETKLSLAQLNALSSFARYLLNSRLDDYVLMQQRLIKEVDLPMMKFFRDFSNEQLFELIKGSSREFLTYLSENRAEEQIRISVKQWRENQLPGIKRDEIQAEDITLSLWLRKKVLLHFIPEYTSAVDQVLDLVNEIDFLQLRAETALTNTYINILKEKISEDALLIEKVNETVPGVIYVFDLQQYKGVYSNNKLGQVIGYSQEELNQLGSESITTLLHPDDQEPIKQHLEGLKMAGDGEVKVFKYRIRDPQGNYRWLSNFESVFKRDEKGNVIQTIGLTLNIDEEEKIAEAMRENEKLHKRAEALTHLGSFTWNLKTNALNWSDELYRIHGLEPGSNRINYDQAQHFIIGEAAIEEEIKKALDENRNADFYYRIKAVDGKEKILHARGSFHRDEDTASTIMIGTVQDVTEKQNLIRKLRHNEAVYKQAEELANMGNWTLDLSTKKLEWTDQLYKIYGLEPQSEEMTIERFLSFVHPDDLEAVKEGTDRMYHENILDYTFHIVTPEGRIRVLRSVAQVQKDARGNPVLIVGSERDITDKQNLIDRLRYSEQLYKQAQALAHLGNWTIDLKTNEITWSEEMYQIYQVDPSTPLNLDLWMKYLPEEERKEVMDYYYECIRDRKSYDKVHHIVMADGTQKTLHRKAELVLDEKGEPVKMIGTTQDITEEYNVQQELKDNQTFIRKITDATPSIISSYNVNTGKYVFISQGLEKLLGYEPEELMDKGTAFIESIIHPDDRVAIATKNAEALNEANAHPERSDLVIDFTYRMRQKKGQYRWFHTYGTVFDRNAEGKVEHMLNITLDIHDQITATEKIKEQEHFIQQIADASPTILYLYDVSKQKIEYINREIFFVLGYLPEEILDAGSSVTEMIYHPDDYHLLPGRIQSGKSFQQVDSMIQYECRLRNKEGEWRWLLVREIVFKTDDNGNISQILGAALDINRRKEMERTILQNTLQLEQSNASLEEFAYVASHDLKEPLRKISTFGDRLVASQMEKLPPDGKMYLQKIIDASQRMQTMINDLLAISMITGNTSFERCSLQSILNETLQTLEFKIEQLNAVIEADPLPEANIIPSQFRQLFQNLLSNSLKFVKPGIQPLIKISYSLILAENLPHYQLSQATQYHRIEFADNGIGFENEYAGKIFAIFQRLHGRSEYEGSGIGLAICKKIVEHHGGMIYASGAAGEGATFTIILPA